MTDEKVDEVLDGLKKLGATGKTRLVISAEDSQDNRDVHDAFRMFAKTETDNDYTLALRILLNTYDSDVKYIQMWKAIEEIQLTLQRIIEQPKVAEEKKVEAF